MCRVHTHNSYIIELKVKSVYFKCTMTVGATIIVCYVDHFNLQCRNFIPYESRKYLYRTLCSCVKIY